MIEGVKTIFVEKLEGGVAKITIDNPPLNLITVDTLRQLMEAVIQAADDETVRVVIITAAGERIFSGGSNMKEFDELRDNFIEKKLRRECAIFSRIESMPKPVIAAVNAQCLGGGCELALSCDFIVMDERAQIGQPEVDIGSFPGSGGLFRLPKRVGYTKAFEMLCLGTAVSAAEALEIGLINRVAPAGKVMETAYDLALQLSSKPRFALKCIKEGVRASFTQTTAEATEMSLRMTEEIMKTKDSIEGTAAFFEKRPPVFEDAYPYKKKD
jgi:enoyl-CoA hydratase/carnithine racemase